MSENSYKERRNSLKSQYKVSGFANMSDSTFLEFMLFFAFKQGETGSLSHELFEKFGSFDRILDANYEELMSVKGISEHAATYITLFQSAMKRYAENTTTQSFGLKQTNLVEKFIRSKYINTPEERAMLLHFDESDRFINYTWVGDGSFERVELSQRKIAASVVTNKSRKVVLVHNHPSGVAMPSEDDLIAISKLNDFLKKMNVYIADNVVISKDRAHFFSKDPRFFNFLYQFKNGFNDYT